MRWFRRLPLLLAVVLLAAFAAAPVARADDNTPQGQFLWWNESDGSSIGTFQAGDGISIGLGHIHYTTGCPQGGTNDFVNVFAKVYIVAHGSVSDGSALTDVGNSPNVVEDSGTSGFIDEYIGTAGFKIAPGTYDVVYDECEDGKYQADTDALFDTAITVQPTPDGSVPSLSPGITALKADAQAQADGWKKTLVAWTALNTLLDVKERIECVMDVVECFLGPDALLGYFQSQVQSALGVDDPKEGATNELVNMVGHYQGIANDPPDPAYKQPTAMDPISLLVSPKPDATYGKSIDMVNAAAQESATAQALLHGIERYQKAQQDNDVQWALVQARDIERYASQLGTTISATNAQLQAFKAAVDGDPRNGELEQLRQGLSQLHDQVAAGGFTAEQHAGLLNAGLTEAQITDLQAKLGGDQNLSDTLNTLSGDLGQQVTIGQNAAGVYDDLRVDAHNAGVDLTSRGLNRSDQGIAASAGGPYTVGQGTALPLDASGTQDPATSDTNIPIHDIYNWDTDGDGQFDDATGDKPSVTFKQPGDVRVGVKVTRSGGDDEWGYTADIAGIAYALVHVTPTNALPTLDSPTPSSATIVAHRGQALSFSVTPHDADAGQTLTTSWAVDGGAFTAGNGSFSKTFGAGDALGLHYVKVKVKDNSGMANDTATRVWSVSLQDTDSDNDGWTDAQDCNDSDPDINPGHAEVAGNGKDDDCNPDTKDTGNPADTAIDSGPTGNVTATDATFAFHADPATGATFECKLDGGAYAACTSPKTYNSLALGAHTFSVRAVNAAGTDATPATRSWTVVLPVPNTTIISGPPASGSSSTATFTFAADPSDGASFECKLDAAAYAACTSPKTYNNLAVGDHTLDVRAKNASGADPTPSHYAWTVTAPPPGPPDTIIDTKPPAAVPVGPGGTYDADFAWHAEPAAGATFQCDIDGQTWACDTAVTVTGIPAGQHTFTVTASNQYGTDATPAQYTFTVQNPPVHALMGGVTVSGTSATVTFSGASPGALSFECSLDGGAWTPCASPYTMSGLAPGNHTVQVRASGMNTAIDDAPVSKSFTIAAPSTGGTGGSGSAGGAGSTGGTGQTGGAGTTTPPPAGGGTTVTPPVKQNPCAGKKGKALTKCKADQALKAALAKCAKLKGKKKSTCVKRAKAVRKCATLTGKKKSTCMRKARKVHAARFRYVLGPLPRWTSPASSAVREPSARSTTSRPSWSMPRAVPSPAAHRTGRS